MNDSYWRKCIVCKKEINYSTKYYKCSIPSCDKKRSPAQFCSVDCWDVHRSIMGHKSAGADEYHSPSKGEAEIAESKSGKVRIVKSPNINSINTSVNNLNVPREILVVVSKYKAFVKAAGDLNTSGDVADVLSDILREKTLDAIQKAKRDGRKTLMGKDFK